LKPGGIAWRFYFSLLFFALSTNQQIILCGRAQVPNNMVTQQRARGQRTRKGYRRGCVIHQATGFRFFPGQADRAAITIAAPGHVGANQAGALAMRNKHHNIIAVATCA
jgi:hypothetical protein